MIKKIFIISIVSLSSFLLYGQSVEPDKRLDVKFSKSELQEIKESNPTKIAYLNYCIDNAYTIMPFPEEKAAASELKGVVNITSLENLNFFELGIQIENENSQYYRIEGESKLLLVHSKEEIIRKMNK